MERSRSCMTTTITKLKGLPDQDLISAKKALLEKIRYATLFIILILIVAIFYAKNNENRLTFNLNVKESIVPLPNVTFCLNSCASCEIQTFTIVNNYKDSNVYCAQPDLKKCIFKGPETVTNDGTCFNIGSENFNIQTFQEYWLVSIFVQFNEEYPQINFKILQESTNAETSFPLLLHSVNNLFFSKSVYQDKTGEQEVTFSPFFQSVITTADPCSNDPNKKCGTLTLAIRVSSMIVPYTVEETNSGLAQRTITDVSSIFSIAAMAITIFFSVFLSRMIFDQQTAWVDHSVRESIIYHINTYPRTKKRLLKSQTNME
ncbi:hypothetical protein DLAC_08677 [Tieghemostelium lacteum]|uniref:Transmembrane protein n=1 Tax=Tieghemostelium lacteum TaxID=361077 RepID=A0A151Z811_TIELA|nr:hypothetical protein DLAC_08677 [Tieghemostelium lacteum]|eukprot:KYQ90092.1 hypothetical protein DLAC_08677 [Tieghemostelium lacteum]